MSDAGGRIAADDLVRFVTAAFASLGAPETDAGAVAELMVEADCSAPTPMACSACANT